MGRSTRGSYVCSTLSLKHDGIYVVEDTHTSYWPSLVGEKWSKFGKESVYLASLAKVGGSLDLNDPKTTMNFFKRLVHGLNYAEFLHPAYTPSYFDKHILAMHFYHNLVVIYKGYNDEGSNIIENNTLRPFIMEELGIKSLEELELDFPNIPQKTHE